MYSKYVSNNYVLICNYNKYDNLVYLYCDVCMEKNQTTVCAFGGLFANSPNNMRKSKIPQSANNYENI